ncbi:MAG: EAL domain-containing protein [Ruminococcus sp.]|nr:EAL domain-containing protein [Ruminococcus sp.]MCM1381470.1 EAL domain-containing protein [Muribaculaceae bacterium]MCM1480388.1 EAL domain-containing protein [Muribaculaceae bacterium]
MSALYFHICAALVLIFLIVSVSDRRFKAGAPGSCFLLLLLITLAALVCDMFTISLDIAAKAGKSPNLFLLYLFNTLYLLLHNFTVPVYMLFVVALTNTWHKLKTSKPTLIAMTVPSVLVALALTVNLFNGSIFYFDADSIYHRGGLMPLLYVLAFVNMTVCTVYIFKCRKLFTGQKFAALVVMLPIEFLAVMLQFLFPNLLVEMFANAVALFLVMTTVQRPEDIQESVTMLKNVNAYTGDVAQNFANEKPFTSIVINISNFVPLHQILGYDGANELLKIAANKLREIDWQFKCRAEIYHTQKGRFRFVVFGDKMITAEEIADKINEEFKKSIVINGLELNMLAYVCVINCPEDIDDPRALIRFGLDIHKRLAYTGRLLRASELLSEKGFELGNALDEIIDRAITNRNFKVYYQPIYSIAEKRFVSAEALLRLKDEKYGFISPELFIVAAERSGAIHKIGDYVIDEVCRFIASDEYKKLGLEYIEVNLSVAQCMSPDLAEKILHTMRKHNVSPDAINLEITETAMSYAQNTMSENIERLYSAGLSFSLDDYGTGYSNINRVASLPLSIVKLDKSFVNTENNPKMWIVLSNTVKMLKDMDMHIVVEGIETQEILKRFADLECDYIQGYYFSKPIPEEEFVTFITDSINTVNS